MIGGIGIPADAPAVWGAVVPCIALAIILLAAWLTWMTMRRDH